MSVAGEIARYRVSGHDSYRDDQPRAAERRRDVVRFDRFSVIIRGERAKDVRENDQRNNARGPENYSRNQRAGVPAQRAGDDLARSEEDRAVNDSRREIARGDLFAQRRARPPDRKSTRLNSSHVASSYAVFCLKKKKNTNDTPNKITKKTKKTT